ncbi:hypothetical protein RJI07_07855 [Mycoplasmatota bacterium WC30]
MAMNIYFDESRNTGEISLDGKTLNYEDQRYFILVGYIERKAITDAYIDFKNKWHSQVKSKNPLPNEIKGNDLMRKDNTDIRNDFIKKFCNGNNFYVTVYDKKFFLVTQMINWLVYRIIDYGGETRDIYYNLCEFLIKVDDTFLGRYVSVTKSNTVKDIEEFVQYVISYKYSECISSFYEIELAMFWRSLITNIVTSDKNYFEELKNDNVLNNRIKGKDRNNIVNLTSLGETILLIKHNNPQLKNTQFKIHHDEIETVQEYIQANWEYKNLDFISSANSIQVQICDNISSVVGHIIKKILPLKNDNDLVRLMERDYEWVKNSLRNVFNRINPKNSKFVISMREMALIKSIMSGNEFSNLMDFQEDIMIRLQSRLKTEKTNHLDLSDAAKILKR